MSSVNLADSLWRDLKYGVRQLRMKPGFALAAVVSLALGIGANTAFFHDGGSDPAAAAAGP